MEIDFSYDYSNLDGGELSKLKITFQEIKSVFENPNSKNYYLMGFGFEKLIYFQIGYSSKQKFLSVVYDFASDKIRFLAIKLSEEYEIQDYYCQKNRQSF
jgi:uncharacterized DUF497 family protein